MKKIKIRFFFQLIFFLLKKETISLHLYRITYKSKLVLRIEFASSIREQKNATSESRNFFASNQKNRIFAAAEHSGNIKYRLRPKNTSLPDMVITMKKEEVNVTKEDRVSSIAVIASGSRSYLSCAHTDTLHNYKF